MKGEYKIPLIFFIVSFLWITFSDRWLYYSPFPPQVSYFISMAKGYFFITFATFIIFILLRQERFKLKIRQDENQHLLEIMNRVDCYIIITDSEGKITWVNKAFENHTGYSLSDVINQYPGSILRGEESCPEAETEIANAIKKQSSCTVEIINYTRQKQKYWVKISIAPLFDESLNLNGFISIQNNTTSYRNAQNLLSEKNTLLKKIAWITSHQLRKPVASILGLNEVLQQETDNKTRDEVFSMLNSCTEELDNIVKSINKGINEVENMPLIEGVENQVESNSLRDS